MSQDNALHRSSSGAISNITLNSLRFVIESNLSAEYQLRTEIRENTNKIHELELKNQESERKLQDLNRDIQHIQQNLHGGRVAVEIVRGEHAKKMQENLHEPTRPNKAKLMEAFVKWPSATTDEELALAEGQFEKLWAEFVM